MFALFFPRIAHSFSFLFPPPAVPFERIHSLSSFFLFGLLHLSLCPLVFFLLLPFFYRLSHSPLSSSGWLISILSVYIIDSSCLPLVKMSFIILCDSWLAGWLTGLLAGLLAGWLWGKVASDPFVADSKRLTTKSDYSNRTPDPCETNGLSYTAPKLSFIRLYICCKLTTNYHFWWIMNLKEVKELKIEPFLLLIESN